MKKLFLFLSVLPLLFGCALGANNEADSHSGPKWTSEFMTQYISNYILYIRTCDTTIKSEIESVYVVVENEDSTYKIVEAESYILKEEGITKLECAAPILIHDYASYNFYVIIYRQGYYYSIKENSITDVIIDKSLQNCVNKAIKNKNIFLTRTLGFESPTNCGSWGCLDHIDSQNKMAYSMVYSPNCLKEIYIVAIQEQTSDLYLIPMKFNVFYDFDRKYDFEYYADLSSLSPGSYKFYCVLKYIDGLPLLAPIDKSQSVIELQSLATDELKKNLPEYEYDYCWKAEL